VHIEALMIMVATSLEGTTIARTMPVTMTIKITSHARVNHGFRGVGTDWV
jgi:hypothetical protein